MVQVGGAYVRIRPLYDERTLRTLEAFARLSFEVGAALERCLADLRDLASEDESNLEEVVIRR